MTSDKDFAAVIDGCGKANGRQWQTWLTSKMKNAYIRLHRLGYAHSVEVWCDKRLAGGTYGVAIGGLFAAESMFYYVRDASKVALVYLVAHLRAADIACSISNSSLPTRLVWVQLKYHARSTCSDWRMLLFSP